jgi:hypothetical protein
MEQAAAAEEAASRLGIDVDVIYGRATAFYRANKS